jgi:hypothetical protein
MTRWATRDLAGQIIKNSSRDGADNWEVIEFPAILPSGNPLWPGFWKIEELEAIKAEIPVSKWEAQYQQNPTSEEGAIVKREYWKIWEESDPPDCEYVIQSWDTAFEKHNRADYSACTTWGVFRHPDKNGELKPNIILLDAFKDRMEFPELKDDEIFLNQVDIIFVTNQLFEEWKQLGNLEKRSGILSTLLGIQTADGKPYFHIDYLIDKIMKLSQEEKEENKAYWIKAAQGGGAAAAGEGGAEAGGMEAGGAEAGGMEAGGAQAAPEAGAQAAPEAGGAQAAPEGGDAGGGSEFEF